MKMLAVPLFVCAMMALTRAAAVPEAEPAQRTGLLIRKERNPTVKMSCPLGWTAYSNRCFGYIPTAMTWANAERYCQNYGGNLASVHTFNEQHVIQSLILQQTQAYPEAWLGGYDATQVGTWFWSDGTPFKFNYWAPTQPDDHAGPNCLAMNYGDLKKFDDQRCYHTKPFVCALKP